MTTSTLALFVLVDVMGAAGAVLVAVPFFREFGLKRLFHGLSRARAIVGLERAGQKAVSVVEAELARFRPSDSGFVIWGLILITLSYLLHTLAEFFEYFEI